MDMHKKSIILITEPRCGSELVMNHLANSTNFENTGEFLHFAFPKWITTATDISDIGSFSQRVKLIPIDLSLHTGNEVRKFVTNEFNNRIDKLMSIEHNFITKTFSSSYFYRQDFTNFERLFDKFTVILLLRKDTFKSVISNSICNKIQHWHVSKNASAEQIKEKLEFLRFNADEQEFINATKFFNQLRILAYNMSAIDKEVKIIYFEDFEDNPTTQLNKLLNTDVDISIPLKNAKFIDDHEKYIINIDRLRYLHNKYSMPLYANW